MESIRERGKSMKLAHLSDLHLGKRVNEFSMLEDQKYILKEIIKIIKENEVEAVLIAGDVYDKTIPSAESVQLLDEFLTGLSRLGLPVFVISGNHDSAERLSFGASLMANSRIYLSGVYNGKTEPIKLQDAYGEINVYLLPFLKPAVVRNVFAGDIKEDSVITYQDALKVVTDRLEVDTAQRNLLVAHQFVTGAGRCDSEEVSVGGLDNVDGSVFEKFDYVALGHIHGPQNVGRETLRYCGTPLKYSFSEARHQKSVTIVDMKEKGKVEISTIPLVPLRDMRKIKGTYLEVTARSFYEDQNTEDYIHITLTDEEEIPGVIEKLRIIYPNLMRLEYDNKRTRENREIYGILYEEEKSELELFEEFYQLQNNEEMSPTQREFLKGLIESQKEEQE
jgi:exonuclease SbcD